MNHQTNSSSSELNKRILCSKNLPIGFLSASSIEQVQSLIDNQHEKADALRVYLERRKSYRLYEYFQEIKDAKLCAPILLDSEARLENCFASLILEPVDQKERSKIQDDFREAIFLAFQIANKTINKYVDISFHVPIYKIDSPDLLIKGSSCALSAFMAYIFSCFGLDWPEKVFASGSLNISTLQFQPVGGINEKLKTVAFCGGNKVFLVEGQEYEKHDDLEIVFVSTDPEIAYQQIFFHLYDDIKKNFDKLNLFKYLKKINNDLKPSKKSSEEKPQIDVENDLVIQTILERSEPGFIKIYAQKLLFQFNLNSGKTSNALKVLEKLDELLDQLVYDEGLDVDHYDILSKIYCSKMIYWLDSGRFINHSIENSPLQKHIFELMEVFKYYKTPSVISNLLHAKNTYARYLEYSGRWHLDVEKVEKALCLRLELMQYWNFLWKNHTDFSSQSFQANQVIDNYFSLFLLGKTSDIPKLILDIMADEQYDKSEKFNVLALLKLDLLKTGSFSNYLSEFLTKTFESTPDCEEEVFMYPKIAIFSLILKYGDDKNKHLLREYCMRYHSAL